MAEFVNDIKKIKKSKYLFDLHAHTAESSNCAGLDAVELVRAYVKAGYDGALITDHFNYSYHTVYRTKTPPEEVLLKGYMAAKEEAKRLGFTIFPGMELKFIDSSNEFIIIGTTEDWIREYKYVYNLGLKAFYKKFHDEVLIIQAHPFRKFSSLEDTRYIDGIEVTNGNQEHDSKNHLAYDFWKQNPHLIATASTDSHNADEVGTAGTYFYEKPETLQELIKALKDHKFELAGKNGLLL